MSEENSGERYRVAYDLATRIATAEGKYSNAGPVKEDGARSYWIDLFEICFDASSPTGTVRANARSQAKAYQTK